MNRHDAHSRMGLSICRHFQLQLDQWNERHNTLLYQDTVIVLYIRIFEKYTNIMYKKLYTQSFCICLVLGVLVEV